ncbi:hypothetical protein EDB19DRAFT_1825503 [Suillus lakei]|nr:hypothetical protein EDB19DRAFT_1825503 [Suillus lakei]
MNNQWGRVVEPLTQRWEDGGEEERLHFMKQIRYEGVMQCELRKGYIKDVRREHTLTQCKQESQEQALSLKLEFTPLQEEYGNIRIVMDNPKWEPSDMLYHVTEKLKEEQNNPTLVGLVGIGNPSCLDMPSSVGIINYTGVRVFTVTGDFKLTIAHQNAAMIWWFLLVYIQLILNSPH